MNTVDSEEIVKKGLSRMKEKGVAFFTHSSVVSLDEHVCVYTMLVCVCLDLTNINISLSKV